MVISHETKRVKKILVELVRRAGGQFQNKTSLFRAFWKAHLAYAASNAGYLSTWPMVRMSNGPGIADFDYLLSELLADGWLTLSESQVGPHWTLGLSLGPACPPTSLAADALVAISEGVRAAGSGDEHLQSRVWSEASDGEELDIYLDLMSDTERSRREQNLAALAGAIGTNYATSRK